MAEESTEEHPATGRAANARQEDGQMCTLTNKNDTGPAADPKPEGQSFVIPHKPLTLNATAEAVSTSPEKPDRSVLLTWKPKYLQRRVFFSLAAVFCSLLICLEVLYQVSHKNQGLVSSHQGWHYLWTYGPTAVFTLIAALWSRIDYQTKQTAPWRQMGSQPSEASKSVLLDYISILQPLSIILALKQRHYLVFATTICSLGLTIIIVFSTGLLSLTTVTVSKTEVPLELLDRFLFSRRNLATVGSMPYLIMSGIQNEHLSYPEGTNSRYAFQTTKTSILPKHSALKTTVDGFSADLLCEQADLAHFMAQESFVYKYGHFTYGNTSVEYNHTPELTFKASDCVIKDKSLRFEGAQSYSQGHKRYEANFRPGTCVNGTDTLSHRILIYITEVIQGPTRSFNNSDGLLSAVVTNYTLMRSTQLICKPTYTINRIEVSINNTNGVLSAGTVIGLSPKSKNRTLAGLQSWDMAQLQFDSLNSTALGAASNDAWIYTYPYNLPVGFDLQFAMSLRQRTGQALNLTDLFKAEIVSDAAEQFYRAYGAQLAKRVFMDPSASPSIGIAEEPEDRLLVLALSARVIEAILGLLVLLTMASAFVLPRQGPSSRNTSTIIGIATILARSPELIELLRGLGPSQLSAIDSRLQQKMFTTLVDRRHNQPQFCVRVKPAQAPILSDKDAVTTSNWWVPVAITTWARTVAVVIVLVTIAVLEGFLHQSNRNSGLGSVDYDGYTHYVWAYMPALAMVLVALYFSSLQFATQVLAPYSKLSEKDSDASLQNCAALNFLDMTGPRAMIMSMRWRYYSVFMTTTAALLGSYLTVVVSGVFSTTDIPLARDVELSAESWFRTQQATDSFSLATSMSTAGLVIAGNLSYPAWTYKDLVFPKLAIFSGGTGQVDAGTLARSATIRSNVPVIRPRLECKLFSGIKEMDVNLTWGPAADERNLLITLPKWTSCRGVTHYPALSFTIPDVIVSVDSNKYFGQAEVETFTAGDYGIGCLDLIYTWGKIGDQRIDHIAAMRCNMTIEEVTADTTFVMPGLGIDPTRPPKLVESSSRISRIPSLDPSYEWLPYIPTSEFLDTFFALLVYGKDGVPFSELGSRLLDTKITAAIQALHGIIVAQQYSGTMRANRTGALGNTTLIATSISSSRLRLVQNAASTRVLEAMLLVMVICAVAAAFLMDTRHVIPKTPCSIAAVASLLADSNMMDEGVIPEGSEWLSDRELEQRGVSSGWTLRMGWWNEGIVTAGGKMKIVAGKFTINIVGLEERRRLARDAAVRVDKIVFTEDILPTPAA